MNVLAGFEAEAVERTDPGQFHAPAGGRANWQEQFASLISGDTMTATDRPGDEVDLANVLTQGTRPDVAGEQAGHESDPAVEIGSLAERSKSQSLSGSADLSAIRLHSDGRAQWRFIAPETKASAPALESDSAPAPATDTGKRVSRDRSTTEASKKPDGASIESAAQTQLTPVDLALATGSVTSPQIMTNPTETRRPLPASGSDSKSSESWFAGVVGKSCGNVSALPGYRASDALMTPEQFVGKGDVPAHDVLAAAGQAKRVIDVGQGSVGGDSQERLRLPVPGVNADCMKAENEASRGPVANAHNELNAKAGVVPEVNDSIQTASIERVQLPGEKQRFAAASLRESVDAQEQAAVQAKTVIENHGVASTGNAAADQQARQGAPSVSVPQTASMQSSTAGVAGGSKVLKHALARGEQGAAGSERSDGLHHLSQTSAGGLVPDAAGISSVSETAQVGFAGTGNHSSPGGAPAAPGIEEAFIALDTGGDPKGMNWTHAGANHAEVGFQDPALGWVGVRADASGGAVHATVLPSSSDAALALGGHMAGLHAYLAENRTPVETLTLAMSGREGGSPAGQNSGQGAQHGAGHNAAQGNDYEPGLGWHPRMTRAASAVSHGMSAAGGLLGRGNAGIGAGGTHISVMA